MCEFFKRNGKFLWRCNVYLHLGISTGRAAQAGHERAAARLLKFISRHTEGFPNVTTAECTQWSKLRPAQVFTLKKWSKYTYRPTLKGPVPGYYSADPQPIASPFPLYVIVCVCVHVFVCGYVFMCVTCQRTFPPAPARNFSFLSRTHTHTRAHTFFSPYD